LAATIGAPFGAHQFERCAAAALMDGDARALQQMEVTTAMPRFGRLLAKSLLGQSLLGQSLLGQWLF
jgi:hypothetical protein